jgi:hypothetical protein
VSGIYTVRVRLTLAPALTRGSNEAQMVHHFEFTDDAEAIAQAGGVKLAIATGAIASNWFAVRGLEVHLVELYRRDLADARSWVKLAEDTFSLPPLATGVAIPLPAIPGLTVVAQEGLSLAHRRSAVLVVSYGDDATFQNRGYIGPLSPCPIWGQFSWFGVEFLGAWVANPATGDGAPNLGDEIDYWSPNIYERAADHVVNLASDYMTAGTQVVVSWKREDFSPLAQVRASVVRADLRSRGVTVPMSPGVTP